MSCSCGGGAQQHDDLPDLLGGAQNVAGVAADLATGKRGEEAARDRDGDQRRDPTPRAEADEGGGGGDDDAPDDRSVVGLTSAGAEPVAPRRVEPAHYDWDDGARN